MRAALDPFYRTQLIADISLTPFDAYALGMNDPAKQRVCQTHLDHSSSKTMPLPDDDALTKRMKKLRLREEDLEEDFIRGSGPGGQKVNKTSSTVVLRHIPSGVEIRCQRERSQVMNRHWARVELCDRMESILNAARLSVQNEREKTRRQNRPRPRGLKRRILETKKNRGQVKKNRGKVSGDD